MDIFLVILFSYLSGSVPFGLIFTKIFARSDIRKIGSGNIGATNVLRTGNKSLAALTLIMDMAKGYIPVLVAGKYFPELIQLSCLLAFLGHIFPIWLKFKGGKGVATYLGILFALSLQLSFLFIFMALLPFLYLAKKYLNYLSSQKIYILILFIQLLTILSEMLLTSLFFNYSFNLNKYLIIFIISIISSYPIFFIFSKIDNLH